MNTSVTKTHPAIIKPQHLAHRARKIRPHISIPCTSYAEIFKAHYMPSRVARRSSFDYASSSHHKWEKGQLPQNSSRMTRRESPITSERTAHENHRAPRTSRAEITKYVAHHLQKIRPCPKESNVLSLFPRRSPGKTNSLDHDNTCPHLPVGQCSAHRPYYAHRESMLCTNNLSIGTFMLKRQRRPCSAEDDRLVFRSSTSPRYMVMQLLLACTSSDTVLARPLCAAAASSCPMSNSFTIQTGSRRMTERHASIQVTTNCDKVTAHRNT